MAEESIKQRRVLLIKMLHAAQSKMSANSLIAELQLQKEKFPKKHLESILMDFAKVDKLAAKVRDGLENEFKTNITAAECLNRFLINYEKLYQIKKSRSNARPNIGTISEDEEMSSIRPPLFDTTKHPNENNKSLVDGSDANGNVNKTSDSEIQEILKKVKEAALENKLSPSAMSSVSTNTVDSALHTSAFSESIQNNNIPHLLDNGRIHSKLYFSKSIIDTLPLQIIAPNCAARSIKEQEQILIEDLLYCFIGLPGDFIAPHIESDSGAADFKVSDQIDVSLRNIVQDILPMASHYSIVQKFAQWSSTVHNQILQALSECMQNILNDYRVSITQLEREYAQNSLNLHKLQYLIRPNMQMLHILAELIAKISASNLQGGAILSLLFDEITLQTGDSMAQKMLIELTEWAAKPYIEMLERWILKGVIIDPYNQFFVVDHRLEFQESHSSPMIGDTARYWDHQYTIQSHRIPRFLENDADIILRTGKYLNVIRQYGKQVSPTAANSTLVFSATNQNHSIFIKQAYHTASKTLLQLFLKENNLMGHISSVKRYFLLQQGDLITQFMEASEEELSKNVDKVTPVRLDNLLQLIVRLSSAKNDPCLEYLHCDLFTMDLARQMSKVHLDADAAFMDAANAANSLDLTGMECFTFRYDVDWPVSIVLNQWVLSQYQMLFRLLFYCKHVDHQLCKAWIQSIEMCKSKAQIKNEQCRTAFVLRQQMLNVIQHLEYYMMIEVIEPNWHTFTEKMKTVHTIDDVINIHQDFLHACLQNCMLQHPDLLQSILKICNVCLRFCKIIGDKNANIDQIGREFNDLSMEFIKALGEQSSDNSSKAKFVSLVCRLNFNSFYN